MADPLSITASIIGVASAGIKLATTLYSYTETVRNSSTSIRDIARDLSITSSVITELGTLLGQDDTVQLRCGSALQTAREAVQGCDEVFKDIQKELDRALERDEKGGIPASWVKRLRWPLVEPKMQFLQMRLERLKNTLVLMLNVINYAREVSGETSANKTGLKSNDQQRQIERLMLLNEEANERSHRLETMLRRFELMQISAATSSSALTERHGIYLPTEQTKSQSAPEAATPRTSLQHSWTTDSGICLSRSSSIVSSNTCGHMATLSRQDSFRICREDLNDCANHVRYLLKVVEDAKSTFDGKDSCEVVSQAYMESLKALQNYIPRTPSHRPTGRLRRIFHRTPG